VETDIRPGIAPPSTPLGVLVYSRCMSRTNIDIDEEACDVVMQRYRLATKREAVNFALRTLAGEPLSLEKARRLRGSGWEGDLEELRATRTP
jgi:Arc/MetJ family transcription regulator